MCVRARVGEGGTDHRKINTTTTSTISWTQPQVWQKLNHLSLGNRFLGESVMDVTELFRQAQAMNARVDYDRAYVTLCVHT